MTFGNKCCFTQGQSRAGKARQFGRQAIYLFYYFLTKKLAQAIYLFLNFLQKTFTGNLHFFLLFKNKRQKLLKAIYVFYCFLTKDKNFYGQLIFFLIV